MTGDPWKSIDRAREYCLQGDHSMALLAIDQALKEREAVRKVARDLKKETADR